MSTSRYELGGLLQLAQIHNQEERIATWRQSMATLAAAVARQQRVPLEGLPPNALVLGVRAALENKLVDDLGFLSPPAAAAALYEMASAIPIGKERRELGRRIYLWMHQGDAPTFIALATQIALSSPKALNSTAIRARVALCLDLPIGVDSGADALALALISRRDVEQEWLSTPSMGSLTSRRLAARLLERAAREAARRAAQGDESAVRVFEVPAVRDAWARLLADREPLVWHHVATARGLLSNANPDFANEIYHGLKPELTPTEWRRAATSLAASITGEPDRAVRTIHNVLESEIIERDRGIAGTLIMGMTRPAESEPDAIQDLLPKLVQIGGIPSVEALAELRRSHSNASFAEAACNIAAKQLADEMRADTNQEPGRKGLLEALHGDLCSSSRQQNLSVPDQIRAAVQLFVAKGAQDAHDAAKRLLTVADGTFATLQLAQDHSEQGRKHAFRAMRELDIALLQKSTLHDLLLLEPAKDDNPQGAMNDLTSRLHTWVLASENQPLDGPITDLTFHMRRMQVLLHLVDGAWHGGDDRTGATRQRRLDSASVLVNRVRQDTATPMRRLVCATTARACDALVREDICEVSDILIAVGTYFPSNVDLRVFSEASMAPEVEASVRAYADLETRTKEATPDGAGERSCLNGLLRLADALPVARSPRVEALRTSLTGLVEAVETIATASSLAHVSSSSDGGMLQDLEATAGMLAQLVAGARMRLGIDKENHLSKLPATVRELDFSVERAVRGDRADLQIALEKVATTMRTELPRLIADAALFPLMRLSTLPTRAPHRERTSFIPVRHKRKAPLLPQWLPPGRVLGGFFVLRALGAGAVGSVFAARRIEQKHDDTAERFALKVPEYSGTAARTLSEKEFLDMFRQEAGALLSLPIHPNIARFVTFDAGAQPKPILVMELVEGPTLERVLEIGDMDSKRAFDILEGIADGLKGMHATGIGHLDVKPSNVILRQPEDRKTTDALGEPVLVDFGLAGRHLRPGCATGQYGAPEIWGSQGEHYTSPTPADVYALGCLAYEVFTGETLMHGANEVALITSHISHDGTPDGVKQLCENQQTAEIGELLRSMLRQDPKNRISIGEAHRKLRELRTKHQQTAWPIATIRKEQAA